MIKRFPLLIAVLALAAWAGNFIIKNFLAASLLAYGQMGDGSAAAVRYAPANSEVLAARARYLLYGADEPRSEEAIAVLDPASWSVPPIFGELIERTGMAEEERNPGFPPAPACGNARPARSG